VKSEELRVMVAADALVEVQSAVNNGDKQGFGRSALNSNERVSTTKLVENFVEQYRKPFSIDILCKMIGRTRKQVRPVVTRLMFRGRIMEVEAGIYVTARPDRVNLSRMNGNMLWSYNGEVGERVLSILDSQSISNVRGLAKVMGVSRQYAYLYLEALASIGLVGYEEGCYVRVNSTRDVSNPKGKLQDDASTLVATASAGTIAKLGSVIEKGILGRLRWPDDDGRRTRGRSKGKKPNMREAQRG